jgi:L-histidine N-alpha-methyltransferase
MDDLAREEHNGALLEANSRFELVRGRRAGDPRAAMAREVSAGLSKVPRFISPKYFYDAVGSRLFDAICELPEYYVTRAERALLERHADAIVGRAAACSLIEIGSGMARKTGLLAEALCARHPSPIYVPFDIAPEAIAASARALLAEHPTLRVRGVVGDFVRDCGRLAVNAPRIDGPRLFAFLGSTIGNLDERAAPALLGSIAELMTEADRFLLGVDLVKDPRILHAAYNDAKGVTAAFNKNVLRVLARELDGDIDERAFEHLAFYSESMQRIEMHLVSTRPQTITLRGADVRIDLGRGERILTEISRKFTRLTTERTLSRGGMRVLEWIPDDGGMFALCVAAIEKPTAVGVAQQPNGTDS